MAGRIVAIGGGGPLGSDRTSPLDDPLLELPGLDRPYVVVGPTAAVDATPACVTGSLFVELAR